MSQVLNRKLNNNEKWLNNLHGNGEQSTAGLNYKGESGKKNTGISKK